ncbi:gas vesicle protein [Streptomyces albidoflavus]|uniref:gas vesicle protein n=1 Tax=Streptomyces albidoflavus TaxID=1886 RepID=UPI0033EBF514
MNTGAYAVARAAETWDTSLHEASGGGHTDKMTPNQPEPIPGQRAVTPSQPPGSRGTVTARGSSGPMAQSRIMEPRRDGEGSLAHVVETLLDKGLVLNADIMVSVAGVELLGIRLRAALASFETASRYGLEFPAGTDTETAAWRETRVEKETCPECGKRSPTRQLLEEWCPWCGWRSAQSLEQGRAALPSTGEDAEDADASRDGGARTAESRAQDEEKGPGGRKPSGRARSEAEAEGTGDRG